MTAPRRAESELLNISSFLVVALAAECRGVSSLISCKTRRDLSHSWSTESIQLQAGPHYLLLESGLAIFSSDLPSASTPSFHSAIAAPRSNRADIA